jgi:histone acetyltransferase (RNA polymerase elongator complex component)
LVKHPKIILSQAITLWLACFALVAHEQIELLTDHDDCKDSVCLVCSGQGDHEAASLQFRSVPMAFDVLAVAQEVASLHTLVSFFHSPQRIRAPPVTQ